MSSNWAENPENMRSSLMQYSLPTMLFSECTRFCVNEGIHPSSDGEIGCIKNCQTKVHSSFDMYMMAFKIKTAQKNVRNYVDISKYTDMEVEHKHDTASTITHVTSPHVNLEGLKGFSDQIKTDLGGLAAEAI